VSGETPGAETADIAKPRPTSCALLDDGERVCPEEGAPGRSETHVLIRWTELSKLLCAKLSKLLKFGDEMTHFMYVEYIFMKAA